MLLLLRGQERGGEYIVYDGLLRQSSKTQGKKDELNYPQQKRKKKLLLNLADVKVKQNSQEKKTHPNAVQT